MIARLTTIGCWFASSVAVSRLMAQTPATWQATTATAWNSGASCPGPAATTQQSLAMSETLAGTAGVAQRRGVSIDMAGALGVGQRVCTATRWSGTAAVRATYGSPRTRIWVAYTGLTAGARDTVVRLPGFSAGIQRRVGRTVLSMSVGPRLDRGASGRAIRRTQVLSPESLFVLPGTTVSQETTYVADTVTRLSSRSVPDLGLGFSWARRSFAIGVAAHVAVGTDIQRFDPAANVEMAYNLSSRVAAIAAVQSRSSLPAVGIPARHTITFGFRIDGAGAARASPNASRRAAASEFRAVSDTIGQISLAVRAIGATQVAVAGDFSHWVPIELQRNDDGWWRATAHASPGAHQVSIRVDAGRWTAPPGLPPVHDEFGTTVGLLIVR